MKRREFITLLGGAAAAWPLTARAQQPAKTACIGFLGSITPSAVEDRLERFRAGLHDLGYVEGQNIFIDFRWAEGRYARLEEFAAELIRLKVDILVTYGTPGTLAAKRATTTVPIVMLVSGDAVATGVVASLARPGRNVTGSTFFDPELSAKRLELFKEAYPPARRIAVLLNLDNPINAPVVEAMTRRANQDGAPQTLLNRGCPQDQRLLITRQHPKVRAELPLTCKQWRNGYRFETEGRAPGTALEHF